MPNTMPALTIQPHPNKLRKAWMVVKFRYHPAMVKIVKDLPARQYDPDAKAWGFECNTIAVQALEGTGAHITLDPACKERWVMVGGTVPQTVSGEPKLRDDGRVDLNPNVRTLAERTPIPKDFPMKTLPMVHQREAFECILKNRKFYLNFDTGTGKTWLFLNTGLLASYVAQAPVAALLIGPNNKIPDYPYELSKHCPHGSYQFIDARGGKRKWEKSLKKAAAVLQATERKPFCFYIGLNWESLAPRLKGIKGLFDVYLEDESHSGKNPNSQRGKTAVRLAADAPWVVRGSADPAPQGPADLWAQLGPLKPGLLPSSFEGHKRRYLIRELAENRATGKKYQHTVGHQNLNELRDLFARVSYRASKDECLDLPPVIWERRYVQMTPQMRASYKEVVRDGVLLLENETQMLAENAAIAQLRARQVCSGFIGLTDMEGKPTGEHHLFDEQPKCEYICDELVPELLESVQFGRQVVIWAYHRVELQQLIERLEQKEVYHARRGEKPRAQKLRVAHLWGDTKKQDRLTLSERFRNGEIDVLVSNPQSGGTGLEFQTADVMIWASRDFSLLLRNQATGRLDRYGQKRKVLSIDVMFEDSIEEYNVEALEAKRNVQDLLRNDPRRFIQEAFSG